MKIEAGAMAGRFERSVCSMHTKRYRQHPATFEVKPLGGAE